MLSAAKLGCGLGVRCAVMDAVCHVVALEVPITVSQSQLASIELPFLDECNVFSILNNSLLRNVTLSALRTQSGRLYVADNGALLSVELPLLHDAGALRVERNDLVRTSCTNVFVCVCVCVVGSRS